MEADKDYMVMVRQDCGGSDGKSSWSGTCFSTHAKVFKTAGDWDIATNWDPEGVPTIDDNVVIRANATIRSGVAEAHQITFEGTPTPTLTLADGGKLVCDNPAKVTVQKEIKAYDSSETGQGNTNGWYFIASPVTDTLAPSVVTNLEASTETEYDLYRLNPSTTMWENIKATDASHHPDFTTLVNGRGYLYANKNNVTLTFAGTPLTATEQSVGLSEGWNLVGNPFNAAATIDVPYYKMNDDGDDIEAVSEYTTTAIPACTGVVVQATASGQQVTFTKSGAKSGGEKTDGKGSLVLSIVGHDKAIVSFNEGSQLGKFIFNENHAKLYIPQGGEDYAIVCVGNGRDVPWRVSTNEMPVNFKAHKNGEYTITVNPEGVAMDYLHLIDNLTGVDVDLLQTPSYTFEGKTSDYASRFKLVFSANNAEGNDDFAFIDAAGNLNVNGDGLLQVFDILGHQLFAKQLSSANCQLPTANFSPGVYVLRLIDGEKVRTQKIVVK